ncbi:hypothetical protein [Tateyamaria pelophila]|uniref:hypothetical protein n=1 Tax=Tateyamaria pelophila TaxID=328415 RepID=UPI001CBAB171|nr:hypothetical protein [Tateyamaria pelophila]
MYTCYVAAPIQASPLWRQLWQNPVVIDLVKKWRFGFLKQREDIRTSIDLRASRPVAVSVDDAIRSA